MIIIIINEKRIICKWRVIFIKTFEPEHNFVVVFVVVIGLIIGVFGINGETTHEIP